MQRPVRVAAPTDLPVSLNEAKAHLRVEDSDSDALIASLIEAAAAHLDGQSGVLGRALVHQTWRQDFHGWPPSGCLRLPFPDVSSVTVKYSDAADAEQTVSAALYEVLEDARGAYVKFKGAFTAPAVNDDRTDAVRVTLVAGYGADSASVPAPLRAAVVMLVAHWYANREAVDEAMTELPLGVAALIAPYRRVGV